MGGVVKGGRVFSRQQVENRKKPVGRLDVLHLLLAPSHHYMMRQRKMKQYPKELKESIITRMLPPNNVSVPELVRETGISKDTLYAWRTKARKGKPPVESNIHGELSSEEKFNIVLETAILNETEHSKYCRRR